MDCAPFREALSAQLDGESPGMAPRWVEEHLADCAACRNWQQVAAEVTRRLRLGPAPVVPDVTARVLQRLPAVAGRRRWWVDAALRLVLVALGAGQLALALPPLVVGDATMSAPLHVAHESGAWNLSIAVAFFAVAARPRLAQGALPTLTAFVVALTAVTVPDLLGGEVLSSREAGHLLVLAGALLVAALAWRGRTRPGPLAVIRHRLPRLRVGLRQRAGASVPASGARL